METSENLTLPGFEQTESELTQSAEAFRAKTSARLAQVQELRAKGLAYGASTLALLASYDHKSSSWRTSQHCLVEGLTKFSETWPRSGMMRNGTAYQLPLAAPTTTEIGSGLLATPTTKANQLAPSMMKHPSCRRIVWPTPTAHLQKEGAYPAEYTRNTPSLTAQAVHMNFLPTPCAGDNRDRGCMKNPSIQRRMNLGKQLNLSMVASPRSGKLNPVSVEWLMGFPQKWTDTDLKPSETQ